MDPKEIWQTALGELEVVFSKANFRTWFKSTFILELSNEEVVIGVPNGFAEDWLKDKYDPEIQSALKKVIPTLKKVSYKVSGQNTPPKPTVAPEKQTEGPEITHPQLNTI